MLTRFMAGAAAALALLAAAPAASAQAGRTAPPTHPADLHQAYVAALRTAQASRISGMVYPRGMRPAAAPQHSGCNTADCALTYHGGPVQRHPHIYLLLWGPKWKRDPAQAASAAYLKAFFKGLGRQPQDTWSTITSQFGSRSGYPAFRATVFKGVWYDMSRPPRPTRPRQFAAEANAFARRHHIRDRIDAQVVIATQSGTCPSGFDAPSVCGRTGFYCGYHSKSHVPFINLPYQLDAGANCGEGQLGSQDAGFSIVSGHEYAETITDPVPFRGWIDRRDQNTGGEIGDKCAWVDPVTNQPNTGTVSLSTGTFVVQPLFSNIALAQTHDGCTLSSPPGGRITGYRGKCLGTLGSRTASGTKIGTAKCAGRVSQFWMPGANGNVLVYGQCLTGGAKGAKVVMSTCGGIPQQQWRRHRNGELSMAGTRLCLTDPRTSARSAKAVMAACKDRRGQRWKSSFKL